MISIGGNMVSDDWLKTRLGNDDIKIQIANNMQSLDNVFTFENEKLFDFEVAARKELVKASERLHNSFFSFKLLSTLYVMKDTGRELKKEVFG